MKFVFFIITTTCSFFWGQNANQIEKSNLRLISFEHKQYNDEIEERFNNNDTFEQIEKKIEKGINDELMMNKTEKHDSFKREGVNVNFINEDKRVIKPD